MKGACAGCPSSTMTLKIGIENLFKALYSEVTEVRPLIFDENVIAVVPPTNISQQRCIGGENIRTKIEFMAKGQANAYVFSE